MEGLQMTLKRSPRTMEGADRRYLSTVMNKALLSEEEELDLARRWRNDGDHKAMHKLVSAYLRLVVATATRFRNYGLPMPDLIRSEEHTSELQSLMRIPYAVFC